MSPWGRPFQSLSYRWGCKALGVYTERISPLQNNFTDSDLIFTRVSTSHCMFQ